MSTKYPDNKISFTPGPWRLQKFRDGSRQPVGPNEFFTTAYVSGADSKEIQANARLIAAAPEIHHLLTLVMLAIHGKLDVEDLVPNIRDVFSKIDGKPWS